MKALKKALSILVALSFMSQPCLAVSGTVTTETAGVDGSFDVQMGAAISGNTVDFDGIVRNIAGGPQVTAADNVTIDASNVGTPLAIDNGIALAGTLIIDVGGNTATLTGAITGAGGLVKQGSGMLSLSASDNGNQNDFTGPVTINAGTLAIWDDSDLGAADNVITFNGGTLQTLNAVTSNRSITLTGDGTIDVAGNSNEFVGQITGAGRLTVVTNDVGDGELFLTNPANDYRGGTLVDGTNGNITLAAGAQDVFGTGAVTVKGNVNTATLDLGNFDQTIASLAGNANGIVKLNGAVLTTGDGTDTDFAGAITGNGDLVKQGSGIFTLSNGDNSWNGGTTINAGTLRMGAVNAAGGGDLMVSANATFDMNDYNQAISMGTGMVTNDGVIKTGSGVLTVAGNYQGAGTLSVTLKPAVANLHVVGTADLSGTALVITGAPVNGVYTVVTAGTLTGTFTTITMPAGYRYQDLTYTGTEMSLSTLQGSAGVTPVPGAAPNETTVTGALNGASAANPADADLTSVVDALNALGSEERQGALNQLSPTTLASMSGLSSAGSGGQSAAVSQRLAGLRTNPNVDTFAFFSVRGKSAYSGALTADPAGDVSSVGRAVSNSDWGLFAAPMGTFGRRDAVSGTSGSQPGYSFSSGGLILGADRKIDEHLSAGFSIGHVVGSAVTADNGGSSASQSLRFGAYGTVYGDDYHGDLYLGGAQDWYHTTRNIIFPGIARSASADPTANELNVSAQGGYDIKTAPVVVSPFAGIAYDRLMIHSFTENGAGAVNLAVNAQTADSVRSTLGVKFSRRLKRGSRVLTPYVSGAWQHELANQSRAITAQFASGGTPFTVNTAEVSKDAGLAGAGVEMDWGKGVSTKLGYTGDLRSDFQAHTFNANVRLSF